MKSNEPSNCNVFINSAFNWALFKFITIIVVSLFTKQFLYLSIHLFIPIKDLVILSDGDKITSLTSWEHWGFNFKSWLYQKEIKL